MMKKGCTVQGRSFEKTLHLAGATAKGSRIDGLIHGLQSETCGACFDTPPCGVDF